MLLTAPALALALLLPMPQAQAAREPRASDARTQQVYLSALNDRGEPVTDLTVKDVTVREDGVAREVLDVRPATEPLTISLLMDDTQSAQDAIQYIRDGLERFIAEIGDHGQMALATFGDRTTPLVEYTSNPAELKKGIGRIFSRSGAGSYLLDAIVDVSRGLEKRDASRPTIVVVSMEGPEFSNRSYQQVVDAVKKSGATLHVLFVGTPNRAETQEMRDRSIAIARATEESGGRRDQVLALSGLPDRMAQLARELTHQYVVTYGRPDALIPPETITVDVTRPGITARARTVAPANAK
jgi:VWFA-related protein